MEEDYTQDRQEILPNRLVKRDINNPGSVETVHFLNDDTNVKMKRETIKEETVKNVEQREDVDLVRAPVVQWIPQGAAGEEEDLFDVSKNDTKPPEASSLTSEATALSLIDIQNGRGARGATKDQWIKLPFLARPLENDQLSSSSPNLEDPNQNRMPRVNFVTQGKGLQTAESRNLRESVPRGSFGRSDLRTDIYPSDKDGRDGRARSLDYSTYSRKSYYYPDDYNRRPYYDDYYDDPYASNSRRDPYYDRYDYKNGRRYDYNDYNRGGYREPYDRYDRYDGYESSNTYDKPRRIIYYANLPDVVRTPPNVYRYSANPYSRYDDDRYYRDNRYNDYRGGGTGSSYSYSRYPYSPLKKAENEGPRDLATSSTGSKDKSENLKRQQEQTRKANEDASRGRDNSLNSHQYPSSTNDDSAKSPHQTLYHDITRMDSDFHRYDHPSFQAAVDDPYISRHD